ncbi:glycosyltransferase family 61 protein [Cyanobium sp. AMD-g]|uniref:glycosyltransferase family 61 protein n=1 Tax=Cyanobium sp. AMD-g TaxID=2823699 RepID=UPI0020CDDAB0|nr:glycosyltransferase family 61 protein [Cyanobium sp. AMD-g]MCP9931917.1 glycosyltransferase family 61 protein [Cyanobium sp. AMD-g]
MKDIDGLASMMESHRDIELQSWLPRDATTEPTITAHTQVVYYSDAYVYEADGSLESALAMDKPSEASLQKSTQDIVSSLNLHSDQHVFAVAVNRWANNYYHWVAQGMASWALLLDHQKKRKEERRLVLLAPHIFKSFQFQWLTVLGGDYITLPRKYAITTGTCLATSSSHLNPSRSSVQQLRKSALASLKAWLRNSPESVLSGLPATIDRIFLSRGVKGARAIHNEFELAEKLESIGYTILDAEKYSVLQQIYIFSRASTVVGFHGAGLTNLIFADPSCELIELAIVGKHNDCFKRLAALLPLKRYSKLHVEAHPKHSDTAATLEINAQSIGLAIESLMEDNPSSD